MLVLAPQVILECFRNGLKRTEMLAALPPSVPS